ncbi:hypothetical protein IIC68_01755 [archaeon]|nr:hypothetical protein [archaeon]
MNESSYPSGPGTGNIIEGRGDPNADIFFVGLAPGAMESARGIVFIGPSGKILNSLIRHGKINIEKCYFDNVFKKQVVEKFKPTI